jgi:hypothetical protein
MERCSLKGWKGDEAIGARGGNKKTRPKKPTQKNHLKKKLKMFFFGFF